MHTLAPAEILFLSRDRGSVQATIPVIKALETAGTFKSRVMTFAANRALFDAWEIPAFAMDEAAFHRDPMSACVAMLDRWRPVAVVSGSSPAKGRSPETPEQFLILAAAAMGIPSLGILDFWGMYRERFCDVSGAWSSALTPTCLCVLDQECSADLVELGMDPARILVTHNPWFDQVHAHAVSGAGRRPEALAEDGMHVLFASQPLREMQSVRRWPYTQHELFTMLLDALDRLPRPHPIRAHVWTHPNEDQSCWHPFLAGNVSRKTGVAILDCRDWEVLSHIDLVVSSHSTVVYEALHYCTPALSLHPGMVGDSPARTDRLKLSLRATDRHELDFILANLHVNAERDRLRQRKADLTQQGVFFSSGNASNSVMCALERLIDADANGVTRHVA